MFVINAADNTWLMSNTQIYFSNNLLFGEAIPNMYSLFDLSNLIEGIILAERIVTLPGYAVDTPTATILNKEGILREAEVNENYVQIISSLKYTWDADSIVKQNYKQLARILCDIFPIEYDVAYNAILESNLWAGTAYRTPNWTKNRGLVISDASGDSYLDGDYHGAHPNVTKETMSQTFVRAIFYLLGASDRGYSYFPDSIRVPITAFLNNAYFQEVFKATKNLILKLDEKHGEKINLINRETAYNRFEINVPSAFTLALKDCNNRRNILDKAIDLRNRKDVKKFRRELIKFENSAKKCDPRVLRQIERLESVLDPEEYDVENMVVQVVNQLVDVIRSVITGSNPGIIAGKALPSKELTEFGIHKLVKFFRTRNLSYLRNLSKELDVIRSGKKNIEQIFDFKLSAENIKTLQRLRAYQSNYLQAITS